MPPEAFSELNSYYFQEYKMQFTVFYLLFSPFGRGERTHLLRYQRLECGCALLVKYPT